MSSVISVIVVLGMLAIACFVFFFVNRRRVQDKLVVFFVEKDKTMTYKMFKPTGKYFSLGKRNNKTETYMIDTAKVILIKFPFVGPSFMKQTVPCLLYARDNPSPLNPMNIMELPRSKTAKEIASVVNEHVIEDIVRATKDASKKDKVPAWIVAGIAVILCLVILVMIFIMRGDINNIKTMIGG